MRTHAGLKPAVDPLPNFGWIVGEQIKAKCKFSVCQLVWFRLPCRDAATYQKFEIDLLWAVEILHAYINELAKEIDKLFWCTGLSVAHSVTNVGAATRCGSLLAAGCIASPI